MSKPLIAITMGDPGGIGPEIILKFFEKNQTSKDCHFLVIGAWQAFESLKKDLSRFHKVLTLKKEEFCSDKIIFFDITEEAHRLLPKKHKHQKIFDIGKVTAFNGAFAYAAIQKGAWLAKEGALRALVTGPVSKQAIRELDPKFIGHTEYLAKEAHVNRFAMMFVSPALKVALVTTHIPLNEVSKQITQDLVYEKIFLTHQFLKQYTPGKEPKLGVCALNPHGKETGPEEESVITPAVRRAQKEGILVKGPYSADQLFHGAYHGSYDGLISMYHDQGLGPFKMLAFHEGVNVTLGLPYIRTSPDHGTAFDIAYQDKANPFSLTAAMNLAQKLVLSRHA